MTATRVVKATSSKNGNSPQEDDDVLSIDLNYLTIDEIETVEDIIDAPIDSLQNPSTRKGKVLRAIALVLLRRDDPNATLEDAGKKRVQFTAEQLPPTGVATS